MIMTCMFVQAHQPHVNWNSKPLVTPFWVQILYPTIEAHLCQVSVRERSAGSGGCGLYTGVSWQCCLILYSHPVTLNYPYRTIPPCLQLLQTAQSSTDNWVHATPPVIARRGDISCTPHLNSTQIN